MISFEETLLSFGPPTLLITLLNLSFSKWIIYNVLY